MPWCGPVPACPGAALDPLDLAPVRVWAEGRDDLAVVGSLLGGSDGGSSISCRHGPSCWGSQLSPSRGAGRGPGDGEPSGGAGRVWPGGGRVAHVFVSFATADHAWAAGLHDWLVEEGHEVFLDRDL